VGPDRDHFTGGDEVGGAAAPLEEELLLLSGLAADEGIRRHAGRIDDIHGRFLRGCGLARRASPNAPPLYLQADIARNLFEYLWTSKPRRFGEHFLLTDVVDAHLDPDATRTVGNCIGLTSLYSVLAVRMGLHLSLLADSDHLMSRLRVGSRIIDMDHTDSLGFDRESPAGFQELPLMMLTASVLNSRGLRHEREGRLTDARADYERALGIHPSYANALNNRGNMKLLQGDMEGAITDYTEAIQLHGESCESHCNRGMAWQRLGRFHRARQDYLRALALCPTYDDASRCLRSLDRLEGTSSA
jgi:tetratricopeptide (TPR) repeat protein